MVTLVPFFVLIYEVIEHGGFLCSVRLVILESFFPASALVDYLRWKVFQRQIQRPKKWGITMHSPLYFPFFIWLTGVHSILGVLRRLIQIPNIDYAIFLSIFIALMWGSFWRC